MDNTALIHRLNRAIGQLEAVKKELENTKKEKDCLKTLRLLKAANNAIKKFGEAYVQQHLSECMIKGKSKEEIEYGLKEAIKSAFDF